MRQWTWKFLGGGILSLVSISSLYAANLDLSAGYNVQALSYSNLNYNPQKPDNQAFIANDASLGVTVRNITLPDSWDGTSMDVGIKFHALGVSGSTRALTGSPFGQVAANYPNTSMTPFLENAYIRIHKILGKSIEATLGRQNFMLGSGLLLDDDGAGFTGATIKANLPFWETSLQGFYFNTDHSIYNYNTTALPASSFLAPSGLNLMGFTFALPTDGMWELNELIENGAGPEIDPGLGYTLTSAMRSFTSLRYQINYGPMIFDGEAAMEKGSANTNGTGGAPNSISYNGNAAVVRAKWKQPLYKVGEGIAHVALAHGSGATGNTGTDTAFFPAHGHQFDGLQRNGFGAFFAATPYAALGTAPTATNLPGGVSGIDVVSGGYTPPAYDNMVLSLDYFLYRADQVTSGSRNLGDEWDATIKRSFRDRLTLSVTGAVFLPGVAAEGGTTPIKTTAMLISLNASGRF